MKTIIAGCRNYNDEHHVFSLLSSHPLPISEVVCGMADGVDKIGYEYARKRDIPVKEFPANWAKHGKSAGPIRNRAMAQYSDVLIAFWDGKSRGTKNMIKRAREMRLSVFVHYVTPKP